MLKHTLRAAAGFGVFLLSTACMHPFTNLRTTPAFQTGAPTLARIAILPFSETENVASEKSAAQLITRYMTEALAEQGIQVIPASDVQAAVGEDAAAQSPAVLGSRLKQKFGVDGVLSGEVRHYEVLIGSAAGAKKPARVGFQVVLYRAQDGEKLLDASFNERQVAASENLLLSMRYPGAGSRWLSAEELARWGSEEVAKSLAKLRKGRVK